MFGSCFVMKSLLSFLDLHHLAEEERAGCFSCECKCSVDVPGGAVDWSIVL